ncbi:hypothetical protein F3087_20715 [Nocardia colli]|uniref:Uncharacterized protein n=1 Tax=Nocardia colli TaxID=2545717 RepID=A0A5N0ED05_9NOCA|nr:hypothetical protein [Nocardia colli]KAA8887312.1 hypothetical protein F3087_20715 [Nocardia colli]
MTRTRLATSVLICTIAYLATTVLLGNRPESEADWVRFAASGVLFAMLFAAGLLLLLRLARR